MSKKGYIICPGYVRSKNDGQIHYIGAGRLIELYELSHELVCGVLHDDTKGFSNPEDYIFLHPRTDGDYRLPPLN